MFTGEDAGRYLFHYTSAFTFLGHILPTMKLRMGPFSEMNDPRESEDWFCSLSGDLGDLDFFHVNREFTRVLKGTAKVICFSRDDPDFVDDARGYLFGRGYAHSSMWDRYASRHTGVCLALEINELDDAIAESVEAEGELIHRWVTYEDAPPQEHEAFFLKVSAINELGLDGALRVHRTNHAPVLYFWKSTDWQREFEYRWVLLSDSDEKYEFVNIRKALRGVIFGADYPVESVDMVRALVGPDVVLARMNWRNGQPIPLPIQFPQR